MDNNISKKDSANNPSNGKGTLNKKNDLGILLAGIFIALAIVVAVGGNSNPINYNQNNVTNINNIIINETICVNCTGEWFVNGTSTYLEPINFPLTVRVNDLIIENQSSIHIGGLDFATLSATNQTPVVDSSRIVMSSSVSFATNANRIGTTFLSGQNLNLSNISSSVVSTSNSIGSAIYLQKWSLGYTNALLGQIVQNGGDSDWIIKRNNMNIIPTTATKMGLNAINISTQENKIRLGFFDDTILDSDINIGGYTNIEYIFEVTQNNITSFNNHLFDDTLYVNQSYEWSGNPAGRTQPDAQPDRLGIFSRDNDKLYFVKPNGDIRRLVDSGSGSIVFDEENVIFNSINVSFNTTEVIFNRLDGVGNDYACLDSTGKLYRSNTACA